jgi:hypothetical protein
VFTPPAMSGKIVFSTVTSYFAYFSSNARTIAGDR